MAERTGRLVLPAAGSTTARLEVEPQPQRERTLRAAVFLVGAVAIMPVVFFVPPHFLWPLVALAAGVYLARRAWVGEYVVVFFEGECPRCSGALEVKPGARIRGRERIECYGCHREPELVLEDDEAGRTSDAGP